MRNEQIIEMAQRAAGVTEECHTYNYWKRAGYQVQKGSKALFKARIWKHATKHIEETDEDESRMFMKTASFFGASQVAPVDDAGTGRAA